MILVLGKGMRWCCRWVGGGGWCLAVCSIITYGGEGVAVVATGRKVGGPFISGEAEVRLGEVFVGVIQG